MPFYEVAWQIELDADTPEDAALTARSIQLDPANIATVYHVRETSAEPGRLIDTDEIVSFCICDFCEEEVEGGKLTHAEMRLMSVGGRRQGWACQGCLEDPDADIYPI